jgi:NitT/TauT family transport system ATP-binding protein
VDIAVDLEERKPTRAPARTAIEPPAPERAGTPKPPAKLVVRNVSKLYTLKRNDKLLALDDVSFSVGKTEVVSLLGPSGCGKSTLLRIMAGLDEATRGEVLLDGSPILRPTKRCGMVFQTYTSFPWLTVRENVEYGLKINNVPKKERRERTEAFIERVQLTRVKDA